MKINEILRENKNDVSSILMDTLVFLKNHGMTEIETLALVSMVQRNGLDGFSYELLLQANEQDPEIKSLIKSIDPKKVKLSSDANSVVNEPEPDSFNNKLNPEEVVSSMAQKALNKRT